MWSAGGMKTIVAMGGGGFSMEPDNPLLDTWLLSLTGATTPGVCFLPTASGDSETYIEKFHKAFSALPCTPRHLSLFRRQDTNLREVVLSQDLIYVGGGNTANMLAVWRVHGLDVVLREAWEAGVVLAGLSAGSLCWFEAGVTDSFGEALAPLADGLGLLPGSHCPHYDGEALRRPRYRELVRSGALPPGLAADDGVALRFSGTTLAEVVSSRPDTAGWRVSPDGEEAIPARYLG
ncbi:MAG: dipeptidase E [Myxococcota bacterium]|jgi:dipeptidase E